MKLEEVPILQKKIITWCKKQAKPVIVATQMLESMVHFPTPTRAEVSDVASAIYDGVDGVMLSAESASGAYPVQAVSMMERIIKQVEKDVRHTQSIKHCDVPALEIVSDSITMAAREIAHTINIGAIITFTYSGMTAIRASSQRPSSPIVAMSKSIETARFLNLLWGVYPIVFEQTCSFHEAIDIACEKILEHKICQKGELVIITGSTNLYQIHSTDTLQLRKI
jgi:pyruvate kinase